MIIGVDARVLQRLVEQKAGRRSHELVEGARGEHARGERGVPASTRATRALKGGGPRPRVAGPHHRIRRHGELQHHEPATGSEDPMDLSQREQRVDPEVLEDLVEENRVERPGREGHPLRLDVAPAESEPEATPDPGFVA